MLELLVALVLAAGDPGVVPAAGARTVDSPSRAPRASRSTPPSLSAGALAAELRESSRRRMDELAELQRERARLEQLSAEIAIARRELAKESALLEEKAAALTRDRAAGSDGKRGPSGDPSSAPAVPDAGQATALARTVKGMKPEQAAAMVGRLERPLAVAILQKLRPPDAAAVLGRMQAKDAAELFTLMAHAGAARP